MNFKITGEINILSNPRWPPKLNSLIVIQHPSYKNNLFVGTVHKYLWENTGCMILLYNNKDYIEPILKNKNVIPIGISPQGIFLLLQVYGWKYVNTNKFNRVFGQTTPSLLDNNHPETQTDLTNEAIYVDRSTQNLDKCNTNDDFIDKSLLNENGELQMEDLFREKHINNILFDTTETFRPLDTTVQNALLQKLNIAETIPEKDQKILVNKNIAIRNIIDTKEDEINEGQKIVKWFSDNLINKETNGLKIFGDLKISIFNGYVHFARQGLKVDDVITPELIPDLKFFKWQYGIPIDYDTLKYLLFQSDFQKNIQRDVNGQKDAEKIFSQEYIISLQPEPKYQIWAFTRLLLAWYADADLQYNIRKVKILINQWRARSDQDFNTKYGVLPSIVIYPRYGKESSRIVLTKLSGYFLLYQNIGWKCSKPSYFIKVNDLMWYTNGSIDLKLYFRKSLKSYDGKAKNTSFDKYFSGLLSADKLLYPYTEK
jgi:hypothetical protein